MIDWKESTTVCCSQCGEALTVPFAHLHFHYGKEGLSTEARQQLQVLVGPGFGEGMGPLGQDICMSCFRELLSLIQAWRHGDLNVGFERVKE